MITETIHKYILHHPNCTYPKLIEGTRLSNEDLATGLESLLAAGAIVEDDGRYLTSEKAGLIRAKIVAVKASFAFAKVVNLEQDIRLEGRDLRDAMEGDEVLLGQTHAGYFVFRVVQRAHTQVVGKIYRLGVNLFLTIQGLTLANTRFMLKDYAGKDEEIVVASITRYHAEVIELSFVRSLGMKNAPGVDITKIILENGAPIEFSNDVEVAVQQLPLAVRAEDMQGRLDLREKLIVTIDGEDAQDFDDAISVERDGDFYLLGVHIADVSFYVQPGTPIDVEAVERGTSIYVTDRVVPMLPFALSNGICSLQPEKERLTLSCILRLNDRGEVVGSQFHESVIRSHARLTYTYLQTVIDAQSPQNEIEEMLILANQLAHKVRQRRNERGALELDLPELKITVDAEGKPTALTQKMGIEAERLIEDFMVLANEAAASTVEKLKLPFIYRIHEKPDPDRLENINLLLIKLGYKPEINASKTRPIDLQKFLKRHESETDAVVLRQQTLRSLARARYDSKNLGHFGLASQAYTHFTSPIRRYPDLLVHRAVKRYLLENNLEFDHDYKQRLALLAIDTSEKERRAVTIERACNDMKAAEFMSSHLGETFWGFIDGFTNSGMFVTLDNGVSGLVRFDTLDDYYILERSGLAIRGRNSQKQYVIGSRVEATIIAANKDTGNVDLSIIKVKKISAGKFAKPRPKPGYQQRKNAPHKSWKRS